MVYRAYSVILNTGLAAQTALEMPAIEADRHAFICLDRKCQVPLTLAGSTEKTASNRIYFTLQRHKNPHIPDCLVAHTDVALKKGRDETELLNYSGPLCQEKQNEDSNTDIQQLITKLPPKTTRGPQKHPAMTRQSSEHGNHPFYDISTTVEAYHSHALLPNELVDLNLSYVREKPIPVTIRGLKGIKRVDEVFLRLNESYNPQEHENEFHYFYGRAFVNQYKSKDKSGYIFTFADNPNIKIFIQVDTLITRLPWFENLNKMNSTTNAKGNKIPGWVFMAGHIYRLTNKKGTREYQIIGQFDSPGNYLYIPNWFNDRHADPANYKNN